MKLHDLQEAKARAVTAMRSLADTADAETRDLTPDEDKRFGELKAEVASLDKRIERATALAEHERSAPAILVNGRGDGTFETRAREFSVTKAIRAAIGDSSVDAGFEREISQEVRSLTGRDFQGIPVPDQIFLEERTVTTAGAAADLVPSVHRADLFIDRLRSATVVERLGATVLSGLQGTVDIPKQTASSSVQWLAEEDSLSETDADFEDVTLSPKTCGAVTSYSRRTILNSSPAIEQIVRNDLARVVANAIDIAALTGDGLSNRPVGIVHQTGVNELTLAGPTWAQVLEFIAAIDGTDAALGQMGWAANPFVVKKLRSTLKVSGDAGAGFIMETPNALAGYALAATTALPGTADADSSPPVPVPATVVFGAFNQLLIGRWGGIDILPNPYDSTAYLKGRVMMRIMTDLDVQVRHPESFAFADDLTV